MQKIMFNDKCGLTAAVLQGRKTMTRRVIKPQYETIKEYNANCETFLLGELDGETFEVKPCYYLFNSLLKEHKGWNNKMFVKADLMPHHIRITDLKVERLQDISDDDCLKEGVFLWRDMKDCPENISEVIKSRYGFYGVWDCYGTPREAFAALIDKVSGRGTWERNPFVFAYEFELEKGGER